MTAIIGPGWSDNLLSLVKSAKRELLIVTPYFKTDVVEGILASLKPRVRLRFLTGFTVEDILSGASDLEALMELAERGEVRHCLGTHAKVYVSDGKEAIVTSSNLTSKGLETNVEIGVRLVGDRLVTDLTEIIEHLWDLAKPIRLESLKSIKDITDLREAYQEKRGGVLKGPPERADLIAKLQGLLDRRSITIHKGEPMRRVEFSRKIKFLVSKSRPSKNKVSERNRLLKMLEKSLSPSSIWQLSKRELEHILLELGSRFGAIGGGQLGRLNIAKILDNPLEITRRSLVYLLWGDEDDLTRLSNLLNSKEWKLQGAGIGVLSALLMTKDPEVYPLYNTSIRKGLMFLEPDYSWGEGPEDYLRFANWATQFRLQTGIDSTEVDYILWEIGRQRAR